MSALSTMVTRRQSLALMVRQDMKTAYTRYRLGFLWTLGEPFMLALMMWVVFTFIFAGRGNIGLSPFIVFLITGIYPFAWLSQSIRKGPRSFRRYDTMLEYSPLPASLWPLRGVLVGFSEFLLSIPVMLIFVLVTGAGLTWGVALFPIAMALQMLLCVGSAMLGAGLSVKWPDVEIFTSIVTRALFWGSPILWSQRNFPEWIQPWLYLNPFHGVLDFYRAAVWGDVVLTEWTNYAISFGVIAAILVAGIVSIHGRGLEIRRME